MTSLEEQLQADPDAGQAFWQDCVTIFTTPAGERVLARLCRLASPLGHRAIADPVLSAHAHGRAEVVASLWRRSQEVVEPRHAPPGA